MYLSLLPKEHNLNNKDITIEYKILSSDKFMLILTDITNRKKLELKIQRQNQIQKMIVAVASNRIDFMEIKFEFESFIVNPPKNLTILLRRLHTFKGVFAQKEMLNIVDGVHNLESKLCYLKKDESSFSKAIKIFNEHKLQDIFNLDLEIISENLGERYLVDTCDLTIDVSLLDSLEEEIKKIYTDETCCSLKDILFYFEKLRYVSFYNMLNTYPSAVNKIAQKLEKDIYPLNIDGDQELTVPDNFKPFAKSLIHVFNNCIDHGIETIDFRFENNKDEIGTISCSYDVIKDKFGKENLQIIIGDDGRGINIDKLLERAIENGLKTQNELDAMNEDEKLLLVFVDKLSTKENVSTTSGRGVGMSSVKNEVEKLDGDVKIVNEVGNGLEFIFTIPFDR